MRAWLMALLALRGCHHDGPICYVPSDQTAGWKQVRIPDAAPALSAPPNVDQFRTGEASVVWESDEGEYEGADEIRHGLVVYRFRLPRNARLLEVEFGEPLEGAKVAAYGIAGESRYPLLHGKRSKGGSFLLEWEQPGLDYVFIEVHRHLRPVPTVRHFHIGRMAVLSNEQWLDPGFRAPRTLYFLHPGGRTVELCNAPARRLSVKRTSITGAPATVTLAPRPPDERFGSLPGLNPMEVGQ
jgi:hypothetical protein